MSNDLRAARILISDYAIRNRIYEIEPFFKLGLVPLSLDIRFPKNSERSKYRISFLSRGEKTATVYDFVLWWRRFHPVTNISRIPLAVVSVDDQETMLRFIFKFDKLKDIEQWISKDDRLIGT